MSVRGWPRRRDLGFRSRCISSFLSAFGFLALTSPSATADSIRVRLFHAGKPLTYLSHPNFSVRTPQQWIASQITPDADGTFTMLRPVNGAYRIHVVLDEDKSNPGDYPGDYNVFQDFQVTDTEPAELIVHMSKLIHMKSPWDNGGAIEGMLTGPVERTPQLEMPRFGLKRQIQFEWDPVVEDAEYRYTLAREGANGEVQLLQKDTHDHTAIVELPPSQPNEAYRFNLFAKKNGRTVGTLFVHDAGAQAWALRFRVGPISILMWATAGAGILFLLGLIAAKKYPRSVVSMFFTGLLAITAAYVLDANRNAKPAISATFPKRTATSTRAGVERTLVEEFQRTVPLPGWWNDVEPELPIHTFSDLQSIWQSGGVMDEARGKRFYKSAYKAIEEHPEVPDLVPFGLYLMSSVAADNNTRQALLKFWVDKFFLYDQRVDNCANCSVGDTTGEMVRAYAESTEPGEGIAIIQKLLKERDKDISAYNWALTFETMAKGQWQMCNKEAAISSLQDGLRRFPKGWQADRLKQTLAELRSSEPTPCTAEGP